MKKITFIVVLVALVLTVLYFSSIELYTLNSGFSWTLSKSLPYLLLVVLGVLLAYLFSKFKLTIKKGVSVLILIILMVLPFGVGFALNPIYEGDFSLTGKEMHDSKSLKNFKNADLVVIAIPGCPYCLASIDKLRLIKKRNPSMKIHFVVSTPNKGDLKNYIDAAKGEISVQQTTEIELSSKLANSTYPTFIQVKNNKGIYKWSNDQFGVRAVDKLESELN